MISAVLEHPLFRTDTTESSANLPDRDASGNLGSYDLFRFHCLREKRNPLGASIFPDFALAAKRNSQWDKVIEDQDFRN